MKQEEIALQILLKLMDKELNSLVNPNLTKGDSPGLDPEKVAKTYNKIFKCISQNLGS